MSYLELLLTDAYKDNSGVLLWLTITKDRIAVMTIALSPECCGGWENAIRIFNLLADKIDLIDENPHI